MGMSLMKFATWLLSPLAIGMFLVLAGIFFWWREWRKTAASCLFGAIAWLWVWGSPWFSILLGVPLENYCPPGDVKTLPRSDAIVVLGGGIGAPTKYTPDPELFPAADRGWQAARCYKAGKAPMILFSGIGEGPGMKRFLMDLGVPEASILLESDSRNTYENAEFTQKKLKALKAKRVILVTSAWHMRRSVAVFKRFGVEVVPCGTDYESRYAKGSTSPKEMKFWLPSGDALSRNSFLIKEYIGYIAYKIHG